jgi:2-hydroxychromene-2-carboxylate isomerase
MGDLISLSARLSNRVQPAPEPVAFLFSPGCAISYLVAERAERALGEVDWVPVLPLAQPDATLLGAARREAHALRLPLELPDDPLVDPRPLIRVACLAAEYDSCARFGLVASRLIFCGGYELDDPQVISEAAEMAGIPAQEAQRAAADDRYDPALEATTASLRRRGLRQTPVVRIGHRWFEGLQALAGAAIALSDGSKGRYSVPSIHS